MNDNNDLQIKIRLESLITEREGMVAENKQRELRGESMAFWYDDFVKLSNEILEILKIGEAK